MAELIGDRIRRLRDEHGMTQTTLAKLWRCSPVNVNHVECRRQLPTTPQLIAFAAQINSTLDALVAGALLDAPDKVNPRPKKRRSMKKAG